MNHLSPQQKVIVEKLRSKDWVCGSVWLNGIKDDRARITSLNRGYMKEHGYEIQGEPCRGKACGRSKCPLFMRRAVKLPQEKTPEQLRLESLVYFEALPN